MLPQNVPFWNKDYFELKAIENQQMQEGFSVLPPLFLLKAGHIFPL